MISEIFRARLLTTFLRQELIAREIVDLLISWNHHSGFQVHYEQQMNRAKGDCIEKIARYILFSVIFLFSYEGTSQLICW